MKIFNIRIITLIITFVLSSVTYGLSPLSDESLSEVTGQSLFNINYVAPSQSSNPSSSIGFYRLGVAARMDINANIDKLRLGCGGVNGAAGCDISIDKLSLTGIKSNGVDAGVLTDFVMNNPFFEFAIKNPTNPALREIVGIRFGAEESWGLLNMGAGPSSLDNDPAMHTGINSFSGYMRAYVENITIPTTLCTWGSNSAHTGCKTFLGGCCGGSELSSTNSTINSNEPNAGDNIFDIILNRGTSVALNNMKVKSLLNLTLTSSLNEDLRFIHQIAVGDDLNGNGLYDPGEGTNDMTISMQKENVSWQSLSSSTTWRSASRGWWMSIPKVTMGNATTNRVYADLGALFGISLTNLDMNQRPIDNCYGGLNFC